MILVIDNISDSLQVSLFRGNAEVGSISIEGRRVDLLAEITKLLTKNKTAMKALKGIAVVAGPGRFSAVRGSVAIANALAFAQQIPVIGISQKEISDILKIEQRLKETKVGASIVPLYDGEPNITVDKKLVKK